MNARGQSLIESVAGVLTLVICCQGLLWLFVMIENSMVIHHILYEALICTQLESKPTNCQAIAIRQIEDQALGSRLLKVDLQHQPNQVTGSVQIHPPWGRIWTLKDSLALPLQAIP